MRIKFNKMLWEWERGKVKRKLLKKEIKNLKFNVEREEKKRVILGIIFRF